MSLVRLLLRYPLLRALSVGIIALVPCSVGVPLSAIATEPTVSHSLKCYNAIISI